MYSMYDKKKNHKRRRLRRSFLVFIILIIIITISVLTIKYFSSIKTTEVIITSYNLSDLINDTNNSYLKYNFADYYVKKDINIDDSIVVNDDNNEAVDSSSYNYRKPVPLSEMVEDNYFDDVVFIGDSRTEGFIVANSLSNVKAFTVKGLMVDTVFTRPAINMDGKKLSVSDALAITQFDKVYIMLGVNELGWAYSEIFINKYTEIIDYVKSLNKNAQIYVQSIIPVSKEKSINDKIYNNKNIEVYNELIKQMCYDKEVYYVNVLEELSDDEGNLPIDASVDGIHLKREYCQKWYDYLKTHTVKE